MLINRLTGQSFPRILLCVREEVGFGSQPHTAISDCEQTPPDEAQVCGQGCRQSRNPSLFLLLAQRFWQHRGQMQCEGRGAKPLVSVTCSRGQGPLWVSGIIQAQELEVRQGEGHVLALEATGAEASRVCAVELSHEFVASLSPVTQPLIQRE